MDKKTLTDIVRADLIKQNKSDELLENRDIIDVMWDMLNDIHNTKEFETFTDYLLHLGLSTDDILWIYDELSKYIL